MKNLEDVEDEEEPMIDVDLLTRHTERNAMMIFCAPNISLSLKKHGILPTFTVMDLGKAEKHKIIAKSINDTRLWRKGLQTKKIDVDCASFETVQERVEAQKDFLLSYKKYRFITSDESLSAFYNMLVFSAIIRTAEQRHAEGRIVDPEVRQRIERYLAQRDNNIGMSQAIGHAKKHDEDLQLAIEDAYSKALANSDNTITPIWTEQLPPLPEGTSHILSWYRLLG